MTAGRSTGGGGPAARRSPIGVALSVDAITVAWPDGRVERLAASVGLERTMTPEAAEALAGMFQQLAARAVDADAKKLAVAVMPPLVEGRSLELPPVSAEEAEAIVRRSPAAHFLSGGEAVLVGVEAGAPERGDGGFLGAAVPRSLADAVYNAVSGAGLELERLVPAHSAWLAAMRDDGPDARALVAVAGAATHVVLLSSEGQVHHRRVPEAQWEMLSEALGPTPGRVIVCAPSQVRKDVLDTLASAGFEVADTGRDAEALASEMAHGAGIEFVPARLAMERRDRSRRMLVRMVAGAVLLLVAAGAVQLWGANRSLDRIRSWRADIRDEVAPLLAVSDSIARMEARRARIESLERAGTGWAVPLVELSVLLPEDAYLEGLQVVGDTLFASAVAERAGAVIESLRGASGLEDVRIEGSIQREVVDGETTHERFRLRAVRGSDWSSDDGASDEGRR